MRFTDDLHAWYASILANVHIEKKSNRLKPEDIKMLPKRGENTQEKQRRAEDDKAAFKRLKQRRQEENAAANARANGG